MSDTLKYYRCPKHQHVAPAMVNLTAEGGTAECGACIMAQLLFMRRVVQLDLMETIATLLRAHAELRTEHQETRRRLEVYEGPAQIKES